MKVVMKSLVLAFAVLFCGITEAKATDCEFQHRPDDFFFRKLPKEIVGWIKCPAKLGARGTSEMNIVYVARTNSLTRDSVLQLFAKYELTTVPDRTATRLSRANTNGWMELESQRPGGLTSHVLFGATALDGSFLVFLYTDSQEGARQARSRLGGLKDFFTVKNQAQLIVDTIDQSKTQSVGVSATH